MGVSTIRVSKAKPAQKRQCVSCGNWLPPTGYGNPMDADCASCTRWKKKYGYPTVDYTPISLALNERLFQIITTANHARKTQASRELDQALKRELEHVASLKRHAQIKADLMRDREPPVAPFMRDTITKPHMQADSLPPELEAMFARVFGSK
jgi:hypothetical protein